MLDLDQVYLGCCLEEMCKIDNCSIDLILCDLPYGVTDCKWDIIIPFDKLWAQYNRIIKKNKPILLFNTEPFGSLLRCSNINNYKYDWIWEKERPSSPGIAKYQPLRYTENISLFCSGKTPYFPIMTEGKKNNSCGSGDRKKNESVFSGAKAACHSNPNSNLKYPKNLIKFQRGVPQVHPTEKPVDLLEYLIKTYTGENDLILDNCAGSGSSLIAAKNTNRRFIGIEKEEKYFNIAKERLQL